MGCGVCCGARVAGRAPRSAAARLGALRVHLLAGRRCWAGRRYRWRRTGCCASIVSCVVSHLRCHAGCATRVVTRGVASRKQVLAGRCGGIWFGGGARVRVLPGVARRLMLRCSPIPRKRRRPTGTCLRGAGWIRIDANVRVGTRGAWRPTGVFRKRPCTCAVGPAPRDAHALPRTDACGIVEAVPPPWVVASLLARQEGDAAYPLSGFQGAHCPVPGDQPRG